MLAASVILAIFWGSSLVAAGCQKTTAIESLDLKSLEGRWYQLSSFGTFFIHGLDRCQVTDITAGSDGKSFVMANDRITRLLKTHFKSNWNLEAVDGKNLNGDLTYKFEIPLIGSLSMPLKILGTDYKNYLIFYVCRELAFIFNYNAGYILTRKRHYPAKELEGIYASIDETLKKNNLPRSKFSLAIQTNCEEKPSPSNTDSTAASSEKPSTDASQTTKPAASTAGAVEGEKTSETPAASGSAANAEQSDGKTSTPDEKTDSVTEKPKDSETEKATASDAEKATAEKAAAP